MKALSKIITILGVFVALYIAYQVYRHGFDIGLVSVLILDILVVVYNLAILGHGGVTRTYKVYYPHNTYHTLKRLIGIILFGIGLLGCLYYLPPLIYQFDPSLGAPLMNWVIKVVPPLSQNYASLGLGVLFGFSSPILMFLLSIGLVSLGFWLLG